MSENKKPEQARKWTIEYQGIWIAGCREGEFEKPSEPYVAIEVVEKTVYDALQSQLARYREALEITVNQRTRGYPTYKEWENIWIKANSALEESHE